MKHDIGWREANTEPVRAWDIVSFVLALVVIGAFFMVELAV